MKPSGHISDGDFLIWKVRLQEAFVSGNGQLSAWACRIRSVDMPDNRQNPGTGGRLGTGRVAAASDET